MRAFYETSLLNAFTLHSGGGAWVYGVRQLLPAPQHQCDPSSDLPAGKEKLAKKPISYTLFSVTFCLLGTSHLEENVQL